MTRGNSEDFVLPFEDIEIVSYIKNNAIHFYSKQDRKAQQIPLIEKL